MIQSLIESDSHHAQVLPSGGDIVIISPKDDCDEVRTGVAGVDYRLFQGSKTRAREYRACWTTDKEDMTTYWIDIGTFWINGVLGVADSIGKA
eukprot:GSA120T00017308001.1